jgi:hypothetical protein
LRVLQVCSLGGELRFGMRKTCCPLTLVFASVGIMIK